ncbi:hypothetical protein B0H67DRAFT_645244 [Lasiosphaeris hirsuta]|uniref:Uncharacterized protein n=1 Tax=Lasiosphaeris hirsuta TaxID=260670 RepID=A0AA40AGR7_9PEZI|nr:hypothetical protein B0H67DRAFT_645244 [Lasiosphaeris hirsuta]
MPYKQELEAVERVFDIRTKLNPKEVQDELPDIEEDFVSLESIDNPFELFDEVIFVKLADHERAQLHIEIINHGYEDEEEGARAEELAEDPTAEIEKAAALLFFHWSWPNAVIRSFVTLASQMSEIWEESKEEYTFHILDRQDWIDMFKKPLTTRHDELFPFDRRTDRVKQLVEGLPRTERDYDADSDPMNKEFFDDFVRILGDYSRGECCLSVAPDHRDVRTWRLLAYQVLKDPDMFACFPGVHHAATALDNHTVPGEYPFRRAWWLDGWRVPFQGDRMPAAGDEGYEIDNGELWGELGGTLREVFASGDVWDPWVLCRLVRLHWGHDDKVANQHAELAASAAFQSSWEVNEAGYLQRRPSSPAYKDLLFKTERKDLDRFLALARRFPVLLPVQTIEFADYGEDWPMEPVDAAAASKLLEIVGFNDDEPWDLVSVKGLRRGVWDEGLDMEFTRYDVYMTDDVRYTALRFLGMPAQAHPCDCPLIPSWPNTRLSAKIPVPDGEDEYNELLEQITERHSDHLHRGGDLVFSRRKLADTDLIEDLDRVLSDWSDVMLIKGRGIDGRGDLIDPDTIYVLETLPGIKARRLKKLGRAVEYGQARREVGLEVAAAYFQPRVDVKFPGRLLQMRDGLRSVMGDRYRLEYSDFCPFFRTPSFSVDEPRWHSTPTATWDATQWQWPRHCDYREVTLEVYWDENWKQQFCDRFEHLYTDSQGGRNSGLEPFYGVAVFPVEFRRGPPGDLGDFEPDLGIVPGRSTRGSAPSHEVNRMAFVFARREPLQRPGRVPWCFMHRTEGIGRAPGSYMLGEYGGWPTTWYHICEYLFDLGKTIFALDRPHGNIHHDNLLIGRRLCRSNGSFAKKHGFVRMFLPAPSGAPDTNAAYVPYIAPEVATSGVSRASDVFAWARLGVHFLSPMPRDGYLFRDQGGDGRVVWFAEVLDGIEASLDPNPAQRLAAGRKFLNLLADVSLSVVLDGSKPANPNRVDIQTRYGRLAPLLPPWAVNAPPGFEVPTRVYRVYGETDFGQGYVDRGDGPDNGDDGDDDDDDDDDDDGNSSDSSDSDSQKPTPGSAAARGVFSDNSSSGDESVGCCFDPEKCDCNTPATAIQDTLAVTLAQIAAEDTDDETSASESGDEGAAHFSDGDD